PSLLLKAASPRPPPPPHRRIQTAARIWPRAGHARAVPLAGSGARAVADRTPHRPTAASPVANSRPERVYQRSVEIHATIPAAAELRAVTRYARPGPRRDTVLSVQTRRARTADEVAVVESTGRR